MVVEGGMESTGSLLMTDVGGGDSYSMVVEPHVLMTEVERNA